MLCLRLPLTDRTRSGGEVGCADEHVVGLEVSVNDARRVRCTPHVTRVERTTCAQRGR